MIYHGLYDTDDVLIDVFSTVAKAVGAAPRGVITVVDPAPGTNSTAWKVYQVQITETGVIAARIEQILGHSVGVNTPSYIPPS